MKKIFAIVAILSLLMVPCLSMAATMSDADLATVTGQSGVTIGVTSMQVALGINTITWGDYDGDQTGTSFKYAGYINVALYPVPMHIGVSGLSLTVDVGSINKIGGVGNTAVILGVSGLNLTVDAFVADINLDAFNGSAADYLYGETNNLAFSKTWGGGYEAALTTNASGFGTVNTGHAIATNCLGVFGISGLWVNIPAATITISAH